MARFLLVMVLVGCGRVAFDPILRDANANADADADADANADADVAPRWALVQTVASDRLMPNPRLTMDPIGSQHLIVVAVHVVGGSIMAITDDSNCNSYAEIPMAHSRNATADDELQMFYAKSSCPGATVISIDTTREVTVTAWEVSGVRTDAPFDTASTLNDQLETTRPLGPIITTGTDGEFVVSVAIVVEEVTQIHPGNEFTNDHVADGNGWAHLTDPMASAGVAPQAQWDQEPAGTYCASTAAFKVGR